MFISLENLDNMRPIGVTSKNANGILTRLYSNRLCNLTAASSVALVNVKLATMTAITKIRYKIMLGEHLY